MKIHWLRLITLLCIIFTSVAAIAEEKMSTRDQMFYDKITSGSLHSLKQAAKMIHQGASRNVIVQDALAEVLYQQYAGAFDGQIDTLSWASRALGASKNGRYHDLLVEVASNGAHKKLRKHAKKALKELEGKREAEQFKPGFVQIPEDAYY